MALFSRRFHFRGPGGHFQNRRFVYEPVIGLTPYPLIADATTYVGATAKGRKILIEVFETGICIALKVSYLF